MKTASATCVTAFQWERDNAKEEGNQKKKEFIKTTVAQKRTQCDIANVLFFCFVVWLTATIVELESFDLELEKLYAWVNQACETNGFQSDHLKRKCQSL